MSDSFHAAVVAGAAEVEAASRRGDAGNLQLCNGKMFGVWMVESGRGVSIPRLESGSKQAKFLDLEV